ncbi:MAG TPA: hypothetical protein VKQ72_22225 [Aggregatilineales bacterium]|nr:hypothetical protein [Aggregatilineales bacterium]
MDAQVLQNITTIGALILGSAYVVGGLIVNLHLARYGITEYQVLRVKYLVVGLIYLVTTLIVMVCSAILTTIFLVISATPSSTLGLGAFSLLACLALFGLWAFEKRGWNSRWRRRFGAEAVYVSLSAFAYFFPVYVAFRLFLGGLGDGSLTVLLIGFGAGIAFLTFVAQIYFYAAYLYGDPRNLDPIGMGIPVAIKLAADEANVMLLSHMGIPVSTPDITERLLLIDETDAHYILATGAPPDLQVFKVNKDLIKGIIYLREK